jgi:SanA protein
MLFRILLYAVITAAAIVLLSRLTVTRWSASRIYSLDDAPNGRVAIVFGAGLNHDGTPTAILRDRVATAAQLFFDGRVEKILMSGDNRFVDYNEPGSMKAYAIELGVSEDAIVLDYAGRRTYDTCYRARDIFGLSEAILVTQQYHLPRAIFTCANLGLDVVGVAADRRTYQPRSLAIWTTREVLATSVALWQVWVSHPVPVLGNPEPIFSAEYSPVDPARE